MNVYILSFFTLLRTFILLADLQCYQSLYGVLSSVSKEGSQEKARNSVIEIFSFSEISVLLRFSVFQLLRLSFFQLLRLSFFQLLRLSVFQFFSFSEISAIVGHLLVLSADYKELLSLILRRSGF
ncbi:hypothetical protein PHYBLDRAFT_161820 [Phycomyces blakesleeanus NRRL 1555(-)]|uniref:Secreted protein n=1 Tax=Phycomyces blakesleeanus (strain ATCC 8743b / DSM 1359 / FGSC 10004 / NBRC 33097 / NRRL 1555) TaxID=763407 RepID=A0A167RA08_PHYB8|nr:hypothetical protein PHYBLDRAFT_161820 [Phycomyces blakesleeanus NRRL 1555(-)]OAD81194.1 hypothetical protein PHYBLDRAFT_161820 [Phycomyces blakesleeanus NRRL 1555(-)]|eukprot:XP_018299234.1 hypothetical protein PHYBLDRAFT_161820 [Phycomyces blakesleeanus NRRL 1555(-)]